LKPQSPPDAQSDGFAANPFVLRNSAPPDAQADKTFSVNLYPKKWGERLSNPDLGIIGPMNFVVVSASGDTLIVY
jgi:hypothetical protein